MHHSAHQTSGSAFFNPRLRFSPCPVRLACRAPTPSIAHPPLATQGHASRLCMTARNIPCHKCFPKASTSVTLAADKTSPQTSDGVCLSLFLSASTISGWLARHRVLAMPAPRVCMCLRMYIGLCLRLCVVSFYMKHGEKKGHVILPQLNQGLHTGEGCCSIDLPDHVNEVPWLCSH